MTYNNTQLDAFAVASVLILYEAKILGIRTTWNDRLQTILDLMLSGF